MFRLSLRNSVQKLVGRFEAYRSIQRWLTEQVGACTTNQLIENVVIVPIDLVLGHTSLLQEICARSKGRERMLSTSLS